MSNSEDFKILLNILARTGLDGDLISEFGKAKAFTHKFDSYGKMQTQSVMMQNQAVSAPMGSEAGNPMDGQEIVPPSGQNQGGMMAGKYDDI